MATIADLFALTPQERDNLEIGPFRNVPLETWLLFADQICEQVSKAYSDGEIELERALSAVLSCSLGCPPVTRAILVARTALSAVRNPPARNGRKPRSDKAPKWVRYSAASLIDMLREVRPKEPYAPNYENNGTTPILEEAIRQLAALHLCSDTIDPRTIYRWYLEAKSDIHSNLVSTV